MSKTADIRFISRHDGAWAWFRASAYAKRWSGARRIEHLDITQIRPGDVILGTLPVHLAAEVCARGGEYWHLSLNLPREQRGQELDSHDITDAAGRLERYHIQHITEEEK